MTNTVKIIGLSIFLSLSFLSTSSQAMKRTDAAVGNAMSTAWHKGVSTNHRNPSEWSSQKSHRTPGEFLRQGNHRTPAEWVSGVPSRNKK